MLFFELAQTSKRIASVSSRGEKTALLADLLKRLPPAEIRSAVAYLSGRTPKERLGAGGAILGEALALSPRALTPTLTVADVDARLRRVAACVGTGATGTRRHLLAELFAFATAEERDFLAGVIGGDLRQGALEGIMEEALGRATETPASDVRRAIMVAGDPGAVAEALITRGREGLAAFQLRLFTPLRPMLALPSEGITEVLDELGEAGFEYKLDGARVQIHKQGDEVRVYTRRLNEISEAVPELVERVRVAPARTLIADGEAIALRPDGTPLPFQITMRRFGRRLGIERARSDQPLTLFLFDLLHMNGEDLIDRPAAERIAALGQAAPDNIIPRLVTADAARAAAFLDEAVARGHEGLMVKSLSAPYEAGRRGAAWRKLKPFYTLDLVVLAAEWGHGRRQGWLSNLHLGARDLATGNYVMLGKTFKGLTDAMLAWQTEKLLELEVARSGWTVFVRPALVVEIAFNEVQSSPRYPAGLALRFARVKRYRTDKPPEDADTLDTVQQIYARTARVPEVSIRTV